MNDASIAGGQLSREKRLEMALQAGPFLMMALALFLLGVGIESHFDKLGSESIREICGLVGAFSGLTGIYLNLQRVRASALEKRLADLERRIAGITGERT